jgi:anti-sigma regulatory factor (Ser/Thr protein kinase)
MTTTMALRLPGDARAAAHARSMVKAMLTGLEVPAQCRDDLVLMAAEACSNAVCHAERAGDIEVVVSVDTRECVIDVGNSVADTDDGATVAGSMVTGRAGTGGAGVAASGTGGGRHGLDEGRLRDDLPDALAEHGRGLAIIAALADTARVIHQRSGWVVLHMVKRITRTPDMSGRSLRVGANSGTAR